MPQETQLEMEAVNLHPETERKFTKLTSIKDVRRKVSSAGASVYTPDMLSEPVSDKARPNPKRKFRDEGSSFLIREALAGVNTSSEMPRASRLPWYENAHTLAIVGFTSVLGVGLLTLLLSLPFRS